jgi:hypothetical protein
MPQPTTLDATGRKRSPITMPGYRGGCSPRNKGQRYPADPLPISSRTRTRWRWRMRGCRCR